MRGFNGMAIISGIIELIGDVDSRKLPVLIFSRDFFIFSRFKNFNAKVLTNFESGINRRSVSDTFHGHFLGIFMYWCVRRAV